VLRDPSPYEYKIELLRFTRRGHNILRQFSSVFEVSESWGYNKFLRLDDLLNVEQGLLSEDGALHFRFHVRPPSIVELVKEQRAYIEHLVVSGNGIGNAEESTVGVEENDQPSKSDESHDVTENGAEDRLRVNSPSPNEDTRRMGLKSPDEDPPHNPPITTQNQHSPPQRTLLEDATSSRFELPPSTHNRVARSESSPQEDDGCDDIASEMQNMAIELTSFTRSRAEAADLAQGNETHHNHDTDELSSLADTSNDTLQHLHDALGGDDPEDEHETNNDDLDQLSEEDVEEPTCSPIHFQITSREESSNEHDNQEFLMRFTKQSGMPSRLKSREVKDEVDHSVEVSALNHDHVDEEDEEVEILRVQYNREHCCADTAGSQCTEHVDDSLNDSKTTVDSVEQGIDDATPVEEVIVV